MFITLTHSRYALSCVYLISLRFAEVGCLIEILSRLITKEKAKKSAFLRRRNFPKMGFLLWNSGKKFFYARLLPKDAPSLFAILCLNLLRKSLMMSDLPCTVYFYSILFIIQS